MHKCNYYCIPQQGIHAIELVVDCNWEISVADLTERFVTRYPHYINGERVRKILSARVTESDAVKVYKTANAIYAALNPNDITAMMIVEVEANDFR